MEYLLQIFKENDAKFLIIADKIAHIVIKMTYIYGKKFRKYADT